MRGKWSAAAVVLLLFAGPACSPQCSSPLSKSTTNSTPVAAATHGPSPTPTAPLQIGPAGFHPGEVGAAYPPVALAATGGVHPYTWAIGSGALPDGLILGADGSVSGSPTSAGNFSFTVQVTDAGGSTAALNGAISVAAALSAALVPGCTRACQVEAGCVDVCGNFGSLGGGTPPYAYSANGYIPPATHLDGLSYAGTFTRPISYWQSTVTVTDSFGETASVSPIFNVFPHVSVAGGTCSGNYLTGCSVNLPISGGSSGFGVKLVSVAPNPNPGCWSPTATTPPSGYSLTVSGRSVVVSVPSRLINGYGAVWTIVVTDQSLCAASTYCSSAPAVVRIGVQCG